MGRKFKRGARKGKKHHAEAVRAMKGAEKLARYSDEAAAAYVKRVRDRDRHFEGQTSTHVV